jgi:hypothetical protein
VAMGGTDPELLSSLASRLARLSKQCGPEEHARVVEASGGPQWVLETRSTPTWQAAARAWRRDRAPHRRVVVLNCGRALSGGARKLRKGSGSPISIPRRVGRLPQRVAAVMEGGANGSAWFGGRVTDGSEAGRPARRLGPGRRRQGSPIGWAPWPRPGGSLRGIRVRP